MTAWYNEIDPFAAQWLRNLIAAGHLPPGDVDERSIEDVRPDDIRGYDQIHFCAGIGVWPYALRRIGWPDDRRICSGSFPCQPFSQAGKGAGFADERHLWPAGFHLITQSGIDLVVGEQVASPDGLAWLDLVQADMEAAGFAFGAVDFCAAGVGAPHIRQRTYWMAGQRNGNAARPNGSIDRLGDDDNARLEGHGGGHQTPIGRDGTLRPIAETGEFSGMGRPDLSYGSGEAINDRVRDVAPRPGPTNGLWSDADWLFCRDGKWRSVEPFTQPLADGATSRVGRLRAYGNACTVGQAEEFLRAALL